MSREVTSRNPELVEGKSVMGNEDKKYRRYKTYKEAKNNRAILEKTRSDYRRLLAETYRENLTFSGDPV